MDIVGRGMMFPLIFIYIYIYLLFFSWLFHGCCIYIYIMVLLGLFVSPGSWEEWI